MSLCLQCWSSDCLHRFMPHPNESPKEIVHHHWTYSYSLMASPTGIQLKSVSCMLLVSSQESALISTTDLVQHVVSGPWGSLQSASMSCEWSASTFSALFRFLLRILWPKSFFLVCWICRKPALALWVRLFCARETATMSPKQPEIAAILILLSSFPRGENPVLLAAWVYTKKRLRFHRFVLTCPFSCRWNAETDKICLPGTGRNLPLIVSGV